MQDLLFAKLKEPTRKRCFFSIFASGLGFFGTIFLVFLPIMRMDISQELSYSYSMAQDMKIIFKSFGEGYLYGILMLLPYLYILGGVIMAIVDTVKGVLHITKLDDYVMEMYDKIKNGTDERSKFRRGFYGENASVGLIISGVVILIFYKMLFGGDISTTGYEFSGFSGALAVPVIFFVAMIVLDCIGKYYKKTVKKEILKEKYETTLQ